MQVYDIDKSGIPLDSRPPSIVHDLRKKVQGIRQKRAIHCLIVSMPKGIHDFSIGNISIIFGLVMKCQKLSMESLAKDGMIKN